MMHGKPIKIPIIVNGRIITPDNLSESELEVFTYENGVSLIMPKFTREHLDAVKKNSHNEIHDMGIDDIVKFCSEATSQWTDPEYSLRNEMVTNVEKITGYCKEIILSDLSTVVHATQPSLLFEILETDLGDPYYLDKFIPYKAVIKHAQPKGKVLHVMVGNVPLAGLFTLIRSIITKNVTIAKLPKRDPVTVLMFALGFLLLNPDHPVSRSLTVAYWDTQSEIGRQMIGESNAVCVWGKLSTMNSLRKMIPYKKEIIEFGPKRSLAVVASGANIEEAALRISYDISIYDQEACFCPLQVFFQGENIEDFIKALSYYLDRNLKIMPKIYTPIDIAAHVSRVKLESLYLNWKVYTASENQWNIILTDHACILPEHPLSRTVFIHPIKELKEVNSVINEDVQTISVFPIDIYPEIAEGFTFLGATRIVECGLVGKPRVGFDHDGIKPLSRLVNWVNVERGLDYRYKYGRFTVEEGIKILFGGLDNILKKKE